MKHIFILVADSEYDSTSQARVADEEWLNQLRKYRGPEAAKTYQPKPLKGFNTYDEAKVARDSFGKEEMHYNAGPQFRYNICAVEIAE